MGVKYRLAFTEQGKKGLSVTNKETGQKVLEKFKWLIENIESFSHASLHGKLSGLFKLRVGDYRAIYDIDRANKIVVIHKIGHRREVYKT